MDILSLLIGFVVGAFTGAAGAYLADKYTDKRRAKEEQRKEDFLWKDICSRFPELISEMVTDFKNPEHAGVRKFFVKDSKTMVNAEELSFEYHIDVHSNISAAMHYLEDVGYIEDITPGNCPMYRMREHFVDRLKMPNNRRQSDVFPCPTFRSTTKPWLLRVLALRNDKK